MELARRLNWFRSLSHAKWRIAILTFLATGLVVVLLANLTLGDKLVDRTRCSTATRSSPRC
jgi:hypothetical protein